MSRREAMADDAISQQYMAVTNIPSHFHAADLRAHFSSLVESSSFICFHFRHRPEKVGKSTEDKNKGDRKLCCVVKIVKRKLDELLRYNKQNWTTVSGDFLTGECQLSQIQLTSSGRSDDAGLEAVDEDKLLQMPELKPPDLMPQGNVGTPTLVFLDLIQQCLLPHNLINKLQLKFPKTAGRRLYANVDFDYRSSDSHKHTHNVGEERNRHAYSRHNILIRRPLVKHKVPSELDKDTHHQLVAADSLHGNHAQGLRSEKALLEGDREQESCGEKVVGDVIREQESCGEKVVGDVIREQESCGEKVVGDVIREQESCGEKVVGDVIREQESCGEKVVGDVIREQESCGEKVVGDVIREQESCGEKVVGDVIREQESCGEKVVGDVIREQESCSEKVVTNVDRVQSSSCVKVVEETDPASVSFEAPTKFAIDKDSQQSVLTKTSVTSVNGSVTSVNGSVTSVNGSVTSVNGSYRGLLSTPGHCGSSDTFVEPPAQPVKEAQVLTNRQRKILKKQEQLRIKQLKAEKIEERLIAVEKRYHNDDDAEEWDRHEASEDDPSNQERNKERLYEEEIEQPWEKGGPGVVFYTDAVFWQEREGDFDEQTTDDLDVDFSVYEGEGTGDKDIQDFLKIRQERRYREGYDDTDRFSAGIGRRLPESTSSRSMSRIGTFESHSKGIGRKVMESQGWKEGQGLGRSMPGIVDALKGEGQGPSNKRGFGYTELKPVTYGSNVWKRPRNQPHLITTIFDDPKTTDPKEPLLHRSEPSTLKHRQSHLDRFT